jgi:hypothetical protein
MQLHLFGPTFVLALFYPTVVFFLCSISLRRLVKMRKITQEKQRNVMLILRYCVVGLWFRIILLPNQLLVRVCKTLSLCSKYRTRQPSQPFRLVHQLSSLSHPARQLQQAAKDESKDRQLSCAFPELSRIEFSCTLWLQLPSKMADTLVND